MTSNPGSPVTSRRGSPKNVANIYECFDDLTSQWRDKALCRNSSLTMEDFFSINSDSRQYLDNDLLNLTIEKAKQFVQMARVENFRLLNPKRRYYRKAAKKDESPSE